MNHRQELRTLLKNLGKTPTGCFRQKYRHSIKSIR